MSTSDPDPVLHAIVRAAVDATGAARGWLVAADPTGTTIVAAVGDEASNLIGATIEPGTGTAGFVIASGQPIALVPRDNDPRFDQGVTALLGPGPGRHRPSSVLSVPCASEDDVVGALELIDRTDGGVGGNSGFTFDDVELATLLAGIAGVALTQDRGGSAAVPEPQQLSSELSRLADEDPTRYAAVAAAVSALLSRA
jgi:GAF domain-containing protein